MNEIIEKEEIKVENMIYEIREKQVMLDSDIAKLYETDTKRVNEAVRRNIEKFPERFSWKLTSEELKILWSQFATANISKKSRSIPRVFTEQGVAKKYLSQYKNVIFMDNDSFHDRFIIIDKKMLYHCGSSFKDLGKKCFAITKIEDIDILNNLLKEIYK